MKKILLFAAVAGFVGLGMAYVSHAEKAATAEQAATTGESVQIDATLDSDAVVVPAETILEDVEPAAGYPIPSEEPTRTKPTYNE